jgi:hypothetical protein
MWAKLPQNEPMGFLFYNTFLKNVDNGSHLPAVQTPLPRRPNTFFDVGKFISLLIL